MTIQRRETLGDGFYINDKGQVVVVAGRKAFTFDFPPLELRAMAKMFTAQADRAEQGVVPPIAFDVDLKKALRRSRR